MEDKFKQLKETIRQKKKLQEEGNKRVLMEIPVSIKIKFEEITDYYKKLGKADSQKDVFMQWVEREHKRIFKGE